MRITSQPGPHNWFGSAMIIAGTSIGAGMLAIPETVAACGFFLSSILLISIWALMVITAFLITEVNLVMPEGANFKTMAEITLGVTGKVITWVAYLLLLYSLTAAYSASGAQLIGAGLGWIGLNFSANINSLLFILVFGGIVYFGTAWVDKANQFLIFFKIMAFCAFLVFILPQIDPGLLTHPPQQWDYLWMTFPILITSFGYHHILPTLRTYVASDRAALRKAIIVGSGLPLVIYLIWVAATLGSIPLHGFAQIIAQGNDLGVAGAYVNATIKYLASWFSMIAVTTSFLGVGLGLFDFNRDTYRISPTGIFNRFSVFLLTFLPPYLFVIFYPHGFVMALGYASIFVAILLIGLPAAMMWAWRDRIGPSWLTHRAMLAVIMLIAVLFIGLEILTKMNALPHLMPA